MRTLFTALILLSGAVQAEPLSKKEWALEAAFLTALVIDYGQTRDIKNHPGPSIGIVGGEAQPARSTFHEMNPLLGKSPSDSRIRNYFLAAGVTHVAVTHLLPRKYRPYWQWGTLALELGVVAHNRSIGLRVDF